MKVLALLGSAKKNGNTATTLSFVEKEMEAQGHEVERVYLNNKDINGCLGCAKCRPYPDEIACVQDDDAIGIMEKMIESDVILFTSPVYFWGFTAQLKGLVDRCYSLVTQYHQPDQTSLLKGKTIGLIATGGSGYEENAEGMFFAFHKFAGFLLAGKNEKLFIGKCKPPEGLPKDTEEKAIAFAKSLMG